MSGHSAYHLDCSPASPCTVDRRALALWPGLDRRALARCRHDPIRIARLVAHRSSLAPSAIRSLLSMPAVTPEEAATWFG